MDRQIVYPASIPLDTDILNMQRSTLIALGYLAQMTLGTNAVADGLACNATQPASLAVSIGPGCLTQFGVVDSSAYGSLPALPTDPLLNIGINQLSTNLNFSAPTTPGASIAYLIEASFLEQDSTPLVLPYYNASNPAQPYSGPSNSGSTQVTQRLQSVQLQVKAGAPATTGSQSTPSADAGWVGLYIVTIPYGALSVNPSNITTVPTAPFVQCKLPSQTPGTHNLTVFEPTTQGAWSVPAGISVVKLRIWGGGGAGGNGSGGAGGGGAGGGYSEGFYPVSPGQNIFVMVGNGGAGSGSSGGSSSFGNISSASGGTAGANGASGVAGSGGLVGGTGSGAGLSVAGGAGGGAFGVSGTWLSGQGGGAYAGAGGMPVSGTAAGNVSGHNATGPGGGGSGGVGTGLGGVGGAGAVLVEW